MKKIEVVVKKELFDALGLSVERVFAYTEDESSYVRINGEVYCNEEWDDDLKLRIKANLCNEAGEIVQIDRDYDKKTFFKVNYETFSISCYKAVDKLKYVEVYPKVVKATEEDDD